MSTDQKTVRKNLRQWFEAIHAQDLDRIDRLADEIYAPDWELHDPREPNHGRGPAAEKRFARRILREFPDLRMTPEDLFGEGDRLAIRLTCSGTHAATGKQLSFPVILISRLVGAKIAEEWVLVGPSTEVTD